MTSRASLRPTSPPPSGALDPARAPLDRAPGGGAGPDATNPNALENVRRAHARELAANVIIALFRLVKLSTLHSLDNQAMVRQVEETTQIVGEYGLRTDHNVSILFAHGSVFVGGQLLRANRGVYEGALELGEILARVGAAEIGIRRDAKPNDFYAFVSVLADALRKPKPPAIDRPSPNIRLRGLAASALLREGLAGEPLDPSAQVARIYASAVVIMRRFFDELRRGRYELPQRVKRVAQRLVDLSTGETPAFLGVTAARNQNYDEAGRAVNTAILALAMTRQVTSDAVQLSRLAMAALLYDCARARLAGVAGEAGAGTAIIPQLSEQQENEAPAATAVVLAALGRINEPSVMRMVVSYEAHWERRRALLGPVYRGLRAPSLQARIVHIARAFNDALTPAPGLTPPTADDAIAKLEHEAVDAADRTAIRLLIGALGIFTTGTVVRLSTGETGIVVQTPSHPSLYSQPRVRIVLDGNGGWLQAPIELDLSHQRRRTGDGGLHIKEVVATSDDPAGAQLRAYAAGPAATSGVRASPSSVFPPSSAQSPPPLRTNPPSYQLTPPSYQVNPQSYQATQPSYQATLPSAQAPPSPLRTQPTQTSPGRGQPRAPVHVVEEADEVDPEGLLVEEDEGPPAAPVPQTADDLPKRPPSAEGTLRKTPFLHLFIYMLDRRLSGTTVLTLPSGLTHSIYFDDGAPAKVRTGTNVMPLDRVLVDEGMVEEAALRGTLVEVMKKNVLHGRLLVMKGILERAQVLHALRVQVLRKVTQLFELPADSRYAYYEDENLLASYGGPELTPAEPLSVIMAGIRLMAGDPLVDGTLAKLAGRPLALHPDAEMRRFQLTRDEQAVVDLIRAQRMPLEELLQGGVAQPRIVRLTIYALVVTRHLDLGVPGKVPVGLGRPPVASEPPRAAPEAQVPAASPGIGAQSPIAPPPPVFVSTPPAPSAPPPSAPPSTPRPASTRPRPPPPPPPRAAPPATVPPAPAPLPPSRRTPPPPPPRPASAQGQEGPAPQAARAAPVPLPGERPETAWRRAEIEQRAHSIDGEDYYKMLGVAPDATAEQVKAAYFALAKTWHPDRLPSELAGVKPLVARVFARFSEAYQTLIDPVKSKTYAHLLRSGSGAQDDQEKLALITDAAIEFQKAEILLKKNDLAGAEQLASRAVEADPDQPEYRTLLVWIRGLRRGDPPDLREGKTSTHHDDLIQVLDEILAKEPEFERALYYRGVLLRRSGRIEKAIRDFRLSAQLNPKNLDAVREVRLYEMRKRGATGAAAPKAEGEGGLLGKLFKR